MKGLFTDTEMNSDNVKDRDSKIAFLQKAIDLTGLQLLHCHLTVSSPKTSLTKVFYFKPFFPALVLSQPMSAKPQKIVAGHEPERTNEWLQALAEAINRKVLFLHSFVYH